MAIFCVDDKKRDISSELIGGLELNYNYFDALS